MRALIEAVKRRLPGDRTAWLATLVFLAAALPLSVLARDERSGMIHISRPTHGYTARNISTGYSDFLGERPFFRENVSFVRQLDLFDGLVPERTDFYFKRPLFAFLAAQVAPFTGILPAFLLVNFAGWALCALAAWRFTLAVFQDRTAAAIAVAFVSGAMGMVAHVGDYSAHLWSFCLYYLGAVLLYESGVWNEQRPLRTHLTLGLAIAVAFLSYNSGLMLLGVYLAVAFRRNRPLHLLPAAVIGVSGQLLWQFLLRANDLGFVDVERSYLRQALGTWKEILTSPPLEAMQRTLGLFAEFLTFDSPGVVVVGAFGLFLLRRKGSLLWFFLVLIAVPIASGMSFGTAAGARGYIVWQISLAFFCAGGRLLALALRGGLLRRVASAVALAAVLLLHLAWSTSHVRGDPDPVKVYQFGLDEGWPLLVHGPPETLSLTGAEPTPVLFGGDASLVEAGLAVRESSEPVPRSALSWRLAAGMRLLFYVYLGAACWMLMRPGRARTVVAALFPLAAVALPALATSGKDERPKIVSPDQAFQLPESTRASLRVRLSDRFLAALTSVWHADHRLAFQVRSRSGTVDLAVYAGDERIPVHWLPEEGLPAVAPGYLCYADDPAAAVAALARAREVTFEITAEKREQLAAWQRRDLAGRELSWKHRGSPASFPADRLPATEIRVIRPDRTAALIGF